MLPRHSATIQLLVGKTSVLFQTNSASDIVAAESVPVPS